MLQYFTKKDEKLKHLKGTFIVDSNCSVQEEKVFRS